MVNPQWQIKKIYKSCYKYLSSLGKYVQNLVDLEYLVSEEVESDENREKQASIKMASVFAGSPQHLLPVDSQLQQLFSIAQKYSQRREYEVIRNGLNAIAGVIIKYLDVRKKTAIGQLKGFLVFGTDVDDFLVSNCERITSLNTIAISYKDIELAKIVAQTYSNIALKFKELEPVGLRTTGPKPMNYAIGYMVQNMEECLRAGMYDIGIKCSQVIASITTTNIEKADGSEIHTAFQDLERKVALYGMIWKQYYLVNSALADMTRIMRIAVLKREWDGEILLSAGLDSVRNITSLALRIIDESTTEGGLSVQHSMGSFYDISSDTAFAILIAQLAENILSEEETEAKRKLCRQFIKINKHSWRFFRDVGQMAGNVNSFLLHFINTGIEQITRAIIFLLKDDHLADFYSELVNSLKWHLSVFWWSYHEAKSINNYHIHRDSDLLANVGMQCIKLGAVNPAVLEIPKSCASFIKTLAIQFLEKGEDRYGFDPPRIIEKICYIAIFARQHKVPSISDEIDPLIVEFQSKYLIKHPDESDRLIRELDDLRNERSSRDLALDTRDQFLRDVDVEELSRYTDHLRKMLNIT